MKKEKLLRNLRAGDHIKVTDATKHPAPTIIVRVTRVQEGRRGITGRRTWQAFFEPHLNFGSWTHVWGYSDDKIAVFNREKS